MTSLFEYSSPLVGYVVNPEQLDIEIGKYAGVAFSALRGNPVM